MRKIFVVICSVTLIFSIVGIAGAISFTDFKPIVKWIPSGGSHSWKHNMPDNFGSNSTVISATLNIAAWFVRDDGSSVQLNGTAKGTLNKGSWWFGFLSWSEFGIKEVLAKWVEGPLEVILNNTGKKGFKLLYSKLKIDYTNKVPVPEPATLLLLGFGLIGVSFFGRKKFPPKSRHA